LMTEKLRLSQEIVSAASDQKLNVVVDLICNSQLGQTLLFKKIGEEAQELTKAPHFYGTVEAIPDVPSWREWMSSATNVAPVLTGCLVAACNGQQQEDGYVKKFTKEKSTDVTIAVVTALAVVTHARNRLTNGFQKFISLLLRHNGAAKWVNYGHQALQLAPFRSII